MYTDDPILKHQLAEADSEYAERVGRALANTPFACKMPSYASDRPTRLTDAQALVLYEVLTNYADYDTITPQQVFPDRNAQDNGRRHTLGALMRAGKVAERADPIYTIIRIKWPEALAAYRAWYAKRGAQFSEVAAL